MTDLSEKLATTALLMTGGGHAATQQLLVEALIYHASTQALSGTQRGTALRTAAQALLRATHDPEMTPV